MTVAAIGGAQRLLFVSCATYELAKQLGVEAAGREFLRQCEQPTRQDLPAARMVARLRQLGNVGLFHHFGSLLTKMRSRAAHAALESGADFWVMLDDDLECDQGTLLRLIVTAGDPDECRVAVLPCLMRGTTQEQRTVNVKWEGSLLHVGPAGNPCRRVEHAGCGCMVVSRGALRRVVSFYKEQLPRWRDDDGAEKVPLFHQLFEDNADGSASWYSEDLSFCRRLRAAGVEIFGLTAGWSVHDGQKLDLGSLE